MKSTRSETAKVVAALAWSCAHCGSLHPRDDRGLASAAACCICIVCKIRSTVYTGQGKKCRRCHEDETLQSAERHAAQANSALAEARQRVEGRKPT